VLREIEAGLAALGQRFERTSPRARRVRRLSLGAIVGVGIVSGEPRVFPRAVLVEGGHSQWTRERARAFGAAGGRLPFLPCGQPSAEASSGAPKALLTRAGADVHVVYGTKRRHTYDGKVAARHRPRDELLVQATALARRRTALRHPARQRDPLGGRVNAPSTPNPDGLGAAHRG